MSTPRPGSLFHGTSVELAPGTVLLPGRSVGRDNHPYLAGGATDRVWVTTSIAAAVAYGIEAVSSDRSRDADLHVYEVTPTGPLGTTGRVGLADFTCPVRCGGPRAGARGAAQLRDRRPVKVSAPAPDAAGVPRPPAPGPSPADPPWFARALTVTLLAMAGGLVWLFWWVFVGSLPAPPPAPVPLVGSAAEQAGRADARSWLVDHDNCNGVVWNSVVHRYSVEQEALVSLSPGQEYGDEYLSAWVAECAAQLPEAIRD